MDPGSSQFILESTILVHRIKGLFKNFHKCLPICSLKLRDCFGALTMQPWSTLKWYPISLYSLVQTVIYYGGCWIITLTYLLLHRRFRWWVPARFSDVFPPVFSCELLPLAWPSEPVPHRVSAGTCKQGDRYSHNNSHNGHSRDQM